MDRRPYEVLPSYDGLYSQERKSRASLTPTSAFTVSEAGYAGAQLIEKNGGPSDFYAPTKDRRLFGWRAGVTAVTALVTSCLLVNVAFLIWAQTSSRVVDGIATLQEGNCKQSANLNTGIHLVINLLSTGMLSGSNYCM